MSINQNKTEKTYITIYMRNSVLIFESLQYLDMVFQGGDDESDNGDMDFGGFADKGTDLSQESSSQDPFSQSQDTFTQPNLGDATMFTGEKLLAQPYKVTGVLILLLPNALLKLPHYEID